MHPRFRTLWLTQKPQQADKTTILPLFLQSAGRGTANFLSPLVQLKHGNSKEDHKPAVSREAQKRYRQRQKVGLPGTAHMPCTSFPEHILLTQVKHSITEIDLNNTKTALQEIKHGQQKLEERNRLCEQVSELSKAHTSEGSHSSLQVYLRIHNLHTHTACCLQAGSATVPAHVNFCLCCSTTCSPHMLTSQDFARQAQSRFAACVALASNGTFL